jgi:ABC-2 type transport system ATP-binding protein
VIQVENVSRRFGPTVALDGVSFRVGGGEIVGFLGPNGAGKTTTLRIAAGYLAPDAGRVLIDGIDVTAEPTRAQRRIGYLPENAPLPHDLRVADYLRFRARLKDVPRREVGARVEAAMARVAITAMAGRLIATLSRGYRQRVGLADALVGRPPALLLDEPTAGLDPGQIRETRDLLRELAREHTVLLSSHILPEVEAVATRVVILVRGRVVAEGAPDALRARPGGAGSRVRVPLESLPRAREALGAEVTDERAGRLRAPVAPDQAALRLVEAGCPILELLPDERTLEEVFLEAADRPESDRGAARQP